MNDWRCWKQGKTWILNVKDVIFFLANFWISVNSKPVCIFTQIQPTVHVLWVQHNIMNFVPLRKAAAQDEGYFVFSLWVMGWNWKFQDHKCELTNFLKWIKKKNTKTKQRHRLCEHTKYTTPPGWQTHTRIKSDPPVLKRKIKSVLRITRYFHLRYNCWDIHISCYSNFCF